MRDAILACNVIRDVILKADFTLRLLAETPPIAGLYEPALVCKNNCLSTVAYAQFGEYVRYMSFDGGGAEVNELIDSW